MGDKWQARRLDDNRMSYEWREGLRLTAEREIKDHGHGMWTISRDKNKYCFYVIVIGRERDQCTCQCDTFARRKPAWCKHICAIQYEITRRAEMERRGKPPETHEPILLPTAIRRSVGEQATGGWDIYNEVLGEEHHEFKVLLHQLCRPLRTESLFTGRPKFPLSDLVYAMVTKVRLQKSGRKMKSILREDQGRGFLEKRPCGNSILICLSSPLTTHLLNRLIDETARWFASLETIFAIDSTFLQTHCRYRWCDPMTRKPKEKPVVYKAHFCTGVVTNVITAMNGTSDRGEMCTDVENFPSLALRTAANGFRMVELIADSIYLSHENCQVAEAVGGRLICTKDMQHAKILREDAFGRAVRFKTDHPTEFWKLYRLRNNAESTASMLKRENRQHLQSKTQDGLVNEILCRAVIHNLKLLVRAKVMEKMEVEFWKRS